MKGRDFSPATSASEESGLQPPRESLPLAAFGRDGFCFLEGVLSKAEVAELVRFTETHLTHKAGKGGVRNLLDLPAMRELAASPRLRAIVEQILGPHARPVRGILFDKTSDANWKVPWHQDVTIAVAERMDAEGFGPWSMKAGVMHVQPPASILEAMVSVRLHLDDCPEQNGALRVIPASHRMGKMPQSRIAAIVDGGAIHVCESSAGAVLLMRPLLVHSSSAATLVGHRRVLHFDFAGCGLPHGLQWDADGDRAYDIAR